MKEYDLSPNEIVKAWSATILSYLDKRQAERKKQRQPHKGLSLREHLFGQIPLWIAISYRYYRKGK
ncbi:MAG: hypothetical protein JWN30_1890 [Bacilli bacterium]|nr:hypothetical protein [Bacilli bacterium]